LDECDDSKSVYSYLAEIVSLVPWLKVIVTSRPLDDIGVDQRMAVYGIFWDLFAVDASEDILKFTRSRFAPGGPLHQLRSQVTEKDIQALAKKSHSLFIWIKTVLSYLDNFPLTHEKLKVMKSILSSRTAASPEKELDQLYLHVLRSVALTSQYYQNAVKNLVGVIYATSRNRSLPCMGLHAFILNPILDVLATPADIHSLVRSKLSAVITIDPKTEALHVCHPSFLDFVASEERSQEFWTEPRVLDTLMAARCFSILKAGLDSKLSIDEWESKREELLALKQWIPQELQYSAVYWLDHLFRSQGMGPPSRGSPNEKQILEACKFLFHEGLHYLLVVLNLVSESNAATHVVLQIIDIFHLACGWWLTDRLDDQFKFCLLAVGRVSSFLSALLVLPTLTYV
jgi:hypothetical protein